MTLTHTKNIITISKEAAHRREVRKVNKGERNWRTASDRTKNKKEENDREREQK